MYHFFVNKLFGIFFYENPDLNAGDVINIFKILSIIFIMTCVSCDESKEDSGQRPGGMNTEDTDIDYYWSEGRKISIKRSDSKSFVLFRSSDEEALLSSLAKMGIQVNRAKILEFGYGGTDNSGDAAKYFLDCKWAEVDINHKEATSLPEVLYAAPYYYGPAGDMYPLTNSVLVYLKNAEDVTLLEKLTKENNVGIIGKLLEMPLWYIIVCSKESTGNALEIANLFCESELFDGVEPAFISRKLD